MMLPTAWSAEAYTLLERNGQPVAALLHDRSLENDPTLVAAGGRGRVAGHRK